MFLCRFRLLAQENGLGAAERLEQKKVTPLWKAFQDEYCVLKYPYMKPSERRHAFHREAHKLIGVLGDKILRAVLETGRSAKSLRVAFLPAVRDSDKAPRVQIRRAEQPTDAQDASKMRRKNHWEQNKSAAAVRPENGCEICYVRHAGALRSCLKCDLPCCIACLPPARSCCRRCPAVDFIEPGREPPQLCDKMPPKVSRMFSAVSRL